MSKSKRKFWESAYMNDATFIMYYNRLMELAITRIGYKNLPDTVDERFLELALFTDGKVLNFIDDELGGLLSLRCIATAPFNVYNIPIRRRAYASNGYNNNKTDKDSVIVYNNYIRTNSKQTVELFAKRLYNIDRAIDVNMNAQKTPILIRCPEDKKLTMEQIYKEFDGNAPVIAGFDSLDPTMLTVLSTGAPYICDRAYTLKTQIWNEALTYLGITNLSTSKKERLVTDEVDKNMGGVYASRYSALNARKQGWDMTNKMFGTNVQVYFREFSEESLQLPSAGGENNE